MMRRCCHLVFLLLWSASLHALQVQEDAVRDDRIGIVFEDSRRSLFARVDQLSAISWQEYRIDALEVTEVVIDMLGSPSQIRFYHLRTVDAESELQSGIASLTGGRVTLPNLPESLRTHTQKAQTEAEGILNRHVRKTFPQTTHARTIEFVLSSLEELTAFYDELAFRFAQSNLSENIHQDAAGAGNGQAPPAPAQLEPRKLAGTLFIIQNSAEEAAE